MAEFTQMAFDPEGGLNNKTAYPTTPSSESAARAQIQHPLDELKNALNGLMSELENVETEHSGAEKIGSAPIDGVETSPGASATTIHDQLVAIKAIADTAAAGNLVPGCIDNVNMFAADVVNQAAIADDAVGSGHIADGAVEAAHLSADCVTGTNIADDAVGSEHIVNGAVEAAHISAGAVTETKLGAAAVTATKIADGAVTATKLADGAVTWTKISAGSVTTSKLANGAVDGDKLDATLSDRTRKITISSSSPSGGSNGDIWIKY